MLCPSFFNQDGRFSKNITDKPEESIEALKAYFKALCDELAKNLKLQQYQQKKLEPDSDHDLDLTVKNPVVFRTITPKTPHNKPSQPLEEEEAVQNQNTTGLKDPIKAFPGIKIDDNPKLIDEAPTEPVPAQDELSSPIKDVKVQNAPKSAHPGIKSGNTPEPLQESTEPDVKTNPKTTKSIFGTAATNIQKFFNKLTGDKKTDPNTINPQKSEVTAKLQDQLEQLEHSSFSLAYNPLDHIKAENKADKSTEKIKTNTEKPSLILKGNKEFIKNFFSDQKSKIAELHKILNDIKDKPDIVEKLKQIHDHLQYIKQQTKANNWQKGNPEKAKLKNALKTEISNLETLIKDKYPKDDSLKTTIKALKAAAEKTSKPSKFVEQVNTVIIGGQLAASYDEKQDSIVFSKPDGAKVMEVKRSGEDSLKIVSGIEIPTNETVTQMVLQAKEALKKINDETKTFKVIDCENSPEAALRIYLFGKAAGLNPVMKDTDQDKTKAAVEEFLKKPEAEYSPQDKKLIEIYNQFSKTPGILVEEQKKELLKALKDWEKDVPREYVVQGSVDHKIKPS